MKKLFVVFAVLALLGSVTAWADHPKPAEPAKAACCSPKCDLNKEGKCATHEAKKCAKDCAAACCKPPKTEHPKGEHPKGEHPKG